MFSESDETAKMGTFKHMINSKSHFPLEINDAKLSLVHKRTHNKYCHGDLHAVWKNKKLFSDANPLHRIHIGNQKKWVRIKWMMWCDVCVCGLCDTNCSTKCARYFDRVGLNCCLKLIRCIRINLETIELIIQIRLNGVFIWRNFKSLSIGCVHEHYIWINNIFTYVFEEKQKSINLQKIQSWKNNNTKILILLISYRYADRLTTCMRNPLRKYLFFFVLCFLIHSRVFFFFSFVFSFLWFRLFFSVFRIFFFQIACIEIA